jgi:AraC family transcriptional regulator
MLTNGASLVPSDWPLAVVARDSATDPEFVFAEGAAPRFVMARWRRRFSQSDGPVQLHHHLLSYCERGGAVSTVWHAGQRFCAQQHTGSVTFLPAGHYERWMLEAHAEVAHLHVYIAADLLRPDAERSPILNCRSTWFDSFFRLLLAEYEACRATAQEHGFDLFDRLGDLLLQRLQDLQRPTAAEPRARVPPLRVHLLRRVRSHIEARLAEPLTVRELAGLVSLSVDHFVRAFSQATGVTPHRWIQLLRLETAAQQLRNGDEHIDVIAHRCGFAGAAHFTASFRRHHGMTPSAYRRLN